MADLMVGRLTGQNEAAAVPVTVGLGMSDATLLGAGAGTEPGTVPGWGPVPAQVAREVVARAHLAAGVGTPPRRRPHRLAGRDVDQAAPGHRRPAEFLMVRDQGTCRTPWCDAPIRHADHVTAWAAGGATDADQLQGLCEACNHTKQAPGWSHRVVDDPTGRHTVETVTPTGHRHRSRAPNPPGTARPRRVEHVSHPERALAALIDCYRAA